ncbi:MAG TPA: hypothetical protein VJK50_00700 [Patescibacteria group bacterium]|nr:hypothetical protein [Patescibacteria group bacterium]
MVENDADRISRELGAGITIWYNHQRISMRFLFSPKQRILARMVVYDQDFYPWQSGEVA